MRFLFFTFSLVICESFGSPKSEIDVFQKEFPDEPGLRLYFPDLPLS